MDTENTAAQVTGQATPKPAPVSFGPGETQEMPHNWAEIMLTAWREKDPRKFGDALAAAAMEAK
jgi:hypothetical protein